MSKMETIAAKLCAIEMKMAAEKGAFYLFALLLKNNSTDKWNLLVAADWLYKNRHEALAEFSNRVESELTEDEMSLIAEIIIIDRADPVLASFQQMFQVEHSIMQFQNFTFNKLHIRHAYLFTSQGKAFNPQVN